MLPLAQQQGVGIIVRSVLLRGVLTHRYALLPDQLAELRSAIAQLSRLADAEGCSLPEMAYRFVLANPAVSTALVGTARSEELEAALAFASEGPLPPTLITAIRQVTVSDRNQLNPGTWPADMGEWQGRGSRRWTTDDGRWTIDDGRWSGRFHGPWSMVHRPLLWRDNAYHITRH